MSENLGSTNIADLVNEDDTDINDDMVDKIEYVKDKIDTW